MEFPTPNSRVIEASLEVLGFSRSAQIQWFSRALRTCSARGSARHYQQVRAHFLKCCEVADCVEAVAARCTQYPRVRRRPAFMLMNRSYLTIMGAIRSATDMQALRFFDALLLGALREDITRLPVTGHVVDHPSWSHAYRPQGRGGFLPFVTQGAAEWVEARYVAATQLYLAEGPAAGFFALGGAMHVLGDLFVPVHAHAVPHSWDLFEWYLEGHMERLVATAPAPIFVEGAGDCAHAIAALTRRFEPDRTHHPVGALLRRLGRRERLSVATIRQQVAAIVPPGIAWVAGLLSRFGEDVGYAPFIRGSKDRRPIGNREHLEERIATRASSLE